MRHPGAGLRGLSILDPDPVSAYWTLVSELDVAIKLVDSLSLGNWSEQLGLKRAR
jgi:hypothetical protein